jgi:hypothetical protein
VSYPQPDFSHNRQKNQIEHCRLKATLRFLLRVPHYWMSLGEIWFMENFPCHHVALPRVQRYVLS